MKLRGLGISATKVIEHEKANYQAKGIGKNHIPSPSFRKQD